MLKQQNLQDIKNALRMVALTNDIDLSLVQGNILNLMNDIGTEPNRREVQSFRDKLRNIVRTAQSETRRTKPAASADVTVATTAYNTGPIIVFEPVPTTQVPKNALNAAHRTNRRSLLRQVEKGENVLKGMRLDRSQKRYPSTAQIREQAAIRAARAI